MAARARPSSAVKFLLDEMWPPDIASQLRGRGHDVHAVAERAELRGQPDSVVFVIAQTEGRAVVTENVVDYRPLAAEAISRGGSHCGLVLTSNRRFSRHDPRTVGRLVTALHELLSTDLDITDREHWLS